MSDATHPPEQELLNAEQEWIDIVIRRDQVAADRILGDEFRLTGPELTRLSTGRAATKEDWLKTLPLIETRSFDLHDAQITIYGKTAVVFVRATLDWSVQGRQLPTNYMLTDIWINREGRWQVVTRVSEPLA